ncbi:hypothetical protein E4P39_13135 [Blastococcus sp. CT_GayMR19]|uniref:hypothetical protein n=1 Tax=Blastococcus sp. CT_GayMR19 TaxID=2559608 RepID=UPI00107486C9|nr:hypothetical protein [Blastococcus sp. CT_GayMR19]TFV74425.1 hypothetical protein E4P39_13135 [Blastococcus sp. CT_GayMR19]
MTRALRRLLIAATFLSALLVASPAAACGYDTECRVELEDSAATVGFEGAGVSEVVGVGGPEYFQYAYRLLDPCLAAAETRGYCSPTDVRECPEQPDRVMGYFVVDRRPIVPSQGPAVEPVPNGFGPGDPIGDWSYFREGCFDITPLNPPPSPGEVFSYFERLPLPTLTTQHQPPGNGLSGLPVIFYTDSPTTQTFTVDVRGFTVVIEARATQYTWHTGDPASPAVVSTDPGRPYPNETVEHDYRSGTYTASLTVTWGATFSINGSAPQNVPGTTTTDGPPVTFDVLQARPVLTDPYN